MSTELSEVVVPHLGRRARALLARERSLQPLEATELVNDVYTALLRAQGRDWRDSAHFFAITLGVMRRCVIGLGRRTAVEHLPVEELESPSVAQRPRV